MPSLPVTRRSALALVAALGATGALGACTPPSAESSASSRAGGAAPKKSPAPEATGPGMPRLVGTVAEHLSSPWSLAPVADGSAFVSERVSGRILRIPPGGGAAQPVGQVTVRQGTREGGLLGLEASPTFERDGLLYAYYTGTSGPGISETDATAAANRVVRLAWDGKKLGDERVIVSGIPASVIHDGGRIRFGPDGHLYIGTGDANTRTMSPDLLSLGGKILRVAPDGSPAPGNPFGTAVFSYGHRNVQGLAWDSHGRLWASEFGPERNDELNLITAGADYGWPTVTGSARSGRSVPAAFVWPSAAEASPSGIAVVNDVAYVSCLRGERLWRVPLPGPGYTPDGSGTLPGATEHFRGQFGRLRDVAPVPGGKELWLLTNEGDASRILRVAL
ncbi:PQQ-dependent sugar dehydrogenase [Sinomonas sp. G460-2]|uniref:PQQ-dependent sugar dehydrogenase n=1 Tax=Sinomonas sp. G460-2 TaxID=3393464 RepID=UPI0039EE48FB